MKKCISIFIILFVILQTQAQTSKREEGIKFGIKGGINASNFMGDVEDNAMRYGLHIGILSEIIINDKISLQPELLYSAQGFKNETPGFYSKSKFDYILLPVLVKYYAAEKLSIEAGPQVGFLVNSINRDNNGNTDIKDQSIVDFGVNLGMSYDLSNGIFVSGRYNLGITNVNNSKTSGAFNYTNSVFQLSVGILF